MEIIYLLIIISVLLVGVIIYWFFWAVDSGQYDDLERESHRILMDNDDININASSDDHGAVNEDRADQDDYAERTPRH